LGTNLQSPPGRRYFLCKFRNKGINSLTPVFLQAFRAWKLPPPKKKRGKPLEKTKKRYQVGPIGGAAGNGMDGGGGRGEGGVGWSWGVQAGTGGH